VIDFVLHFDKHLIEFVATYGVWVYGLLFGIIFAETGLVVTPFLPGDSLLFAAGALAAQEGGGLNPWLVFTLLSIAAFEEYGGKAIILGRFVPIVRTFVPFVAGAAKMTPASFVAFNAIGAVAWVGSCVLAGVLFGNVPIIKNNFSLVTIGIVAISLLPVLVEFLRHRGIRAKK